MLKRCLIAFSFCFLFIPHQSFCQIIPQKGTKAPEFVSKRAVAIITFENLSAFPENDRVGASFAETLSTKLSKVENLDLYERRQFNKVLTGSGLDQRMVSEENKKTGNRELWNYVEKLHTLKNCCMYLSIIGGFIFVGGIVVGIVRDKAKK